MFLTHSLCSIILTSARRLSKICESAPVEGWLSNPKSSLICPETKKKTKQKNN